MAFQNSFFDVGTIIIFGNEETLAEVGEEGFTENPNQGHFDID